MTDRNKTEIVVVIDKSGSMTSLKDDAVGGFNQFLKEQKELPGVATLTLAMFDTEYTLVHNNEDLVKINELTQEDYQPGGMTALLDAVGRTVDSVGARLNNTPEHERPSKVVFCIITDGHENSSKEYQRNKIYEMVRHQQEKYSWNFIFLGANVDSFKESQTLGIIHDMTGNFVDNYLHTGRGTQIAYAGLSRAVRACRLEPTGDTETNG